MRIVGLWLGVLVVSLLSASAQITVEVVQDQGQFLPGEAVPTAVRITNLSGQALHLGAEEDWLTFSVESNAGRLVAKIEEVPVTGEFVLESSKVATKHVDLAPYFSLRQPGRYSVTATVRIKSWNREIPPSPPKSFDIIEGAVLKELEFGVPPSGTASNATPEVRKYILQQANYLRNQIRLYLRVTDVSGEKIFRVVPIGSLLSFSRPEFQLDKFARLHVLYENGPHSFSYTVFNPDGELVARQTYDFMETRARLRVDAEGRISVVGGTRRVTANDFPPPEPANPPEEAKPPKS